MAQPEGFPRTATMGSTNWADDVEEDEALDLQRGESMQGVASPKAAYSGPPGGSRGSMDEGRGGGYGGGDARIGGGGPPPGHFSDAPPLPDQPPFKAYLGNIPYDLDEEVVAHFFQGLEVSQHEIGSSGRGGSSMGKQAAIRRAGGDGVCGPPG